MLAAVRHATKVPRRCPHDLQTERAVFHRCITLLLKVEGGRGRGERRKSERRKNKNKEGEEVEERTNEK